MLRFDRTVSESYKAAEKFSDLDYWRKKSITERLEAAYYLNSVAYNFDPESFPRMDKGFFSARKRG